MGEGVSNHLWVKKGELAGLPDFNFEDWVVLTTLFTPLSHAKALGYGRKYQEVYNLKLLWNA